MKYTIPLTEDKIRTQSNKMLFGGGVVEKGIPSTATNYWGLSSNRGRHLRAKANMGETAIVTTPAYTFYEAKTAFSGGILTAYPLPIFTAGFNAGIAAGQEGTPRFYKLGLDALGGASDKRTVLITTQNGSAGTFNILNIQAGNILVTKYNGTITLTPITQRTATPNSAYLAVNFSSSDSFASLAPSDQWLDIEFTIVEAPGDVNSQPTLILEP